IAMYLVFRLADVRMADTWARWMSMPAIGLVTLAVALTTMRSVRAKLFDPNHSGARDCGTPPALLRDSDGRLFSPEPEYVERSPNNSVIVQIARAVSSVPNKCCSCMGPADRRRKPAFCD